jgi:hypothetical protein
MFGIKIIKESEYNDLVQCALRHYEAHKKECVAYERTKKDCESLREQLNAYIMKEKNSCDAISELAGLKDFVILKSESYPCEKCTLENNHCKKLIFADRTICVTSKENINNFTKKQKSRKK